MESKLVEGKPFGLFTSLAEDLNLNSQEQIQPVVIAGPLDCNSSAVTCGPHSLHSNIQLGRFGCYMVKAVSVCMTAIKQICLILNINFFINIYKSSLWKNWEIKQWQIQGKGLGGPKTYPPPPHQTWHLFETEILHWQDCISLFHWLIFLMKCMLHFTTKLNC